MLFNKYYQQIKTMFSKEKVVGFLEKQGFYIALFICIFIIGVTVLFTSGKEIYSRDDVDEDNPPMKEIADGDLSSGSEKDGDKLEDIDIKIEDVVAGDIEKEKEEEIQVSDSFNSGSAQSIDNENYETEQIPLNDTLNQTAQRNDKSNQMTKIKNNKHNEISEEQNNTDVKPVVSQQEISKITMTYPVEGEVIREYSMDQLIYSNTLKEWTTHPGMDIESFLGAEVKAAMDGIVKKIEEDPLMGIVITLDHGNGIKTRYANLSTANMVEENQKVKAGQVISGIGRTAGAEILDPPHLHFELIIDGKYVNPAEYLN